MAVKFPQYDNEILGGSDTWDNGLSSEILLQDYFEEALATTTYVISENTGATLSGFIATFSKENSPTTNYSTNVSIEVFSWAVGDRGRGFLLPTGLASVPAGTVSNVKIRLRVNTALGDQTVSIYRLLRNQVQSQLTYNQFSSGNNWTSNGGFDASDVDLTASASTLVLDGTTGYYEWAGTDLTQDVQDMLNGTVSSCGWLMVLNPDTSYGSDSIVFDSDNASDGFRPELVFDLVSSSGGAISGIGSSRSGIDNSASGLKIAISVGASKSGTKSNANIIKIAQSIGATKVGSTASVTGQQGTTASGIGATKAGVKNSTSGFKIATGIGASCVGVDNSASGTKIAISIGAHNVGIDSSASGVKIAQSIGATKVGSTASVTGQQGTTASGIGATKAGIDNSANGFKIAISVGASKSGTKSNANIIKIAQSIGATKVGSTASVTGQQGTTASGIGATKAGVKNSTSGFKIATVIGASCVGVDNSANGTKSTSGIGTCKLAINSSANIRKLSSGVGATRTGFKSRPSGELFVPTIQKKIKNWRGAEWITVSQGFWSS